MSSLLYVKYTLIKHFKKRESEKKKGCVLSEEIPKAFLHVTRHEIEERMRHMQWKGHTSWKREDFVR